MQNNEFTTQKPWTLPWWKSSAGNASILFYLVIIHILAVTGLILFPIPSLKVFLITAALTIIGGVGTTVCYHRSLSHRALKLNRVVEDILIFFTMFNGSGSPMSWVANHRHHHSKADTEEDVSSPRHGGFWWAHIRWIINGLVPRSAAGVLIWTSRATVSGFACRFQCWRFPSFAGCCLDGKDFSGLVPFV